MLKYFLLKQFELTVVIPTFNEEKFIYQAIRCAKFAREIIVIDSHSSDNTVKIAEDLGCKVIKRVFDNFSNQKNFAISRAKYDWVFILDADEYIIPNLQAEIGKSIQNSENKAFYIPRRNLYMNRFLNYGSNGRDALLRLIHKKYCHYEGLVHEKMIVNGNIGKIETFLYHYTYNGLNGVLTKKLKYANFQFLQLQKKHKQTKWSHILIKPGFRFFSEFLLRKGFMDGVAGLASTRMNGFGVLSRYVRLLIAQHKIKDPYLQNYDQFCLQLNKDAQSDAQEIYSKTPSSLGFWIFPKIEFLNFYLIKGNFFKGKEGYILSYLYSFKCFQTQIYRWLAKHGLE